MKTSEQYSYSRGASLDEIEETTFKSPFDAAIRSAFEAVLGRAPEFEERFYWDAALSHYSPADPVDMLKTLLKNSVESELLRWTERTVLVDLKRFQIYARRDDHPIGYTLVEHQEYEPRLTTFLQQMLKPGNIIIDLGANIGYHTLLAASIVSEAGHVYAVEPNFVNLQLLYASLYQNRFFHVTVFPYAASNNCSILKLKEFGSNGVTGTPERYRESVQYIQSARMDDLIPANHKVDFIKMDIEGYEPFAFQGMTRIIERYKPTLVTEFSPWHIWHRTHTEPFAYLRMIHRYGYHLSVLDLSGTIQSYPSPEALMTYWQSFGNNKQHLDIIAQAESQRLSLQVAKQFVKQKD